MTQETDAAAANVQDARRSAMAVLARAEPCELQEAWNDWPDQPMVRPLRGPETGLVMVRGRIGGGGTPFNIGEATVTRATVELSTGRVGHAHALGTDKDKVRHAAIIDALWQDEAMRPAVEERIVAPIRERLDRQDRARSDETAATRVDFFTMVRGEDE